MSVSKDNATIAKNTIIVYIRLIVTAVVGLISSRYVLQILGASDFGLYSVIGGVIAMFTFISGSLQSTTVRFINYELGKASGDLNKVFNIARQIHIVFAFVILLVAEIVGVYYIQNYLNVESGKTPDAFFVFHVSIVVACLGIVNVPYQGLMVAHEKFSHVACIEIFCAICKLLLIVGLIYLPTNALRAYAAGMSLLTLLSFAIYLLLCRKYWPSIVKYKLVKGQKQHKEMLIFNNYTLLSTISLMGRNQGSNLLINFFYGTIVNAAYAISNTVHVYVNTFAGSFDQASAPQITQNISKGNHERALYLVNHTCRICILLVEIVYFILIADIDYVLYLWLGTNVPAGTAEFCRLTLLLAVVSATSGGLAQYIKGIGRIKWFTICMTLLYMMGLGVAIIIYKNNGSPYSIVVIFIVADLLTRCSQLLLLKRITNFPIRAFLSEAYFRPALVFIIGYGVVAVYQWIAPEQAIGRIAGISGVGIILGIAAFRIGLYEVERTKIISNIANKIKK